MERTNSEDGNGGLKLPIGFRFHPTDEELVVHYLKRKVYSLPLPATIISEIDVVQSNPWDLPGDLKEKRYFFCKRKRSFMNKCSNSFSTDCGYWKAIGKDKQIMAPGSNLIIGMKKSFVFYQGSKSPGQKTQWIMHEFCLVGSINTPFLAQNLMIQVGDWVVSRVYERKKKSRMANTKKSRNLNGIEGRFSPSLSCSSEITEISCNDLDQEEISQII